MIRKTIPESFGAAVACAICSAMFAAAPLSLAQANPAPASREEFEIASVKPSAPVPPTGGVYFGPPRGGPGTPDPGLITWTYARLRDILTTAYDIKTYQLSGPAWLDTERYDILAKVPAGATEEQVRMMWQNLLAERFGVALHHESKEFRVEELVIDKGGSKLKETDWDPTWPLPPGPPQRDKDGGPASPGQFVTISPRGTGLIAHTIGKAQPISKLAATIGGVLDRPVLDRTGLTGKYDYTFDYMPDRSALPPLPAVPGNGPGAAAGVGDASDSGPDITSAIQQQLGLKLVPGKATIDVVIVDKAEKAPTAN